MEIQKNDIVEVGYKSKNPQILKIVYIKDDSVEAIDIFTKEKIILPINQLYDKSNLENLDDECLKQLKLLKANKIWLFLNKADFKEIDKKNISDSVRNIDDKQIESLRKWFLENKEEYKKEGYTNIFEIKKEEKTTDDINIFGINNNLPLSRFIKKI